MTWSKLSDDYGDDTWTLTDAAYRVHTNAIVWSNRKLLDLRLTWDDIRRLTRETESLSQSVAELVSKGFWQQDGDDYLITHHADYQRTRQQVINQQATNRKNGAQGGRPPKVGRERITQSVSEPRSESKTERDGTGQGRSALKASTTEVEPWPEVPVVPIVNPPERLGGNPECSVCGKSNLFHPASIERGTCAHCVKSTSKVSA